MRMWLWFLRSKPIIFTSPRLLCHTHTTAISKVHCFFFQSGNKHTLQIYMTGLFYEHICGSIGNGKSCSGRVEDEANAPSSSSSKAVMLMDSPTMIMARRRTNRTTIDKARSMMSLASPRNIRQQNGNRNACKPFRHNSAPSESSRRDSTERTSDAGPPLPDDDLASIQSPRIHMRPSLGLRFQSEAKLRLHQQNEQRRQSYYCPPNNNKDEPRLFRGPINKLMLSHGTTSEATTRSDEWHHASQRLAEELTQRFGQQPCSRSSAIGRPDDDGVGRLHLSAGSLLDPSATLHQRPKLEHALQLQSQRMRNLRLNYQALSLSLPNLDECDAAATVHADVIGTGSQGRRKENNSDISTSFDLEIEPDEEEQERLKQEKLSSTFHPMSLLPPPSPFEGAGPPDEAVSADVVSPSPEADDRASACHVVYQQYLEDYATSNIPDLTRNFPHFELAEVMQGRFLGKGSFAQVIEVKGFCLKHDGLSTSWALTRSTHQRRRDMAGGSVAKCSNSTNINDDNTGDGDNKCTLEYSFEVQQKQDVVDGSRTKSANDDSDCSGEGDDDVSPLKRGFRLGYHDITDDDDDDELYGADNNGCLLIPPIPDGSTGSDKDGSSTAGSADDDGDGFISNMTPSAASGQNNDLQSSRRFVADHCYRSSNANGVAATNTNAKNSTRPIARYALKQLRPNVGDDPLCLLQGLSDMATETRVLSSMADHPNIVKLRGIAHHDGGDGNPFFQQYFILLDRLYDTLESRIVKWKREEQRWCGPVRKMLFDRQQVKRRQLWLDRVTFAYDLSSALAHLHDRYVVHRDLVSCATSRVAKLVLRHIVSLRRLNPFREHRCYTLLLPAETGQYWV